MDRGTRRRVRGSGSPLPCEDPLHDRGVADTIHTNAPLVLHDLDLKSELTFLHSEERDRSSNPAR